jgi:hypothetical protein
MDGNLRLAIGSNIDVCIALAEAFGLLDHDNMVGSNRALKRPVQTVRSKIG